ncbi:MAG: substrate-binding domain-containing protein [Muribaculaceae bacterium]|nr:substrate-binding domain-containing protein [Muribaculaceae bacterium]MBR5686142.1 substrate-binding domain-containing protein [Muribaculaceae bacterium]
MMRNNSIQPLLTVLAIVLLFTACDTKLPKSTSTRGIAKIMCDESFQSILEQEIAVFEFQYPEASIMPKYINEHDAMDSLLNKKVDLIITSHDLTTNQRELLKVQGRGYRSRMIAVDAIAIIVNKQNDIDELTMQDLRDIFNGKVIRWGQVLPTKLKNDTIKVMFDGSGTGVVNYMKEKFVEGDKFGPNVYARGSSLDVFDAVEKYKNVIGFIGVSWITSDLKSAEKPIAEKYDELQNKNEVSMIDFTDRIKVMPVREDDKLEAYKPYQAHINSGAYPLVRTIWAIDASYNGMLDHGFYAFLTGVIGQKIILQTGILPAAEPVRYVEVQ